jgi:hypothetical protein
VSDSCWRNVKCTNERRICQSHGGYGFDECVAQAYPIDELILEDISQGSCRRTSPRWRIGRKETSFIGGLWSMYIIISGKNKRKRPPLCLIKAIQEQYPNPSGEPYVDFKQAKKRKR